MTLNISASYRLKFEASYPTLINLHGPLRGTVPHLDLYGPLCPQVLQLALLVLLPEGHSKLLSLSQAVLEFGYER